MQIRILTIFAKFSYIQLTFLAKSRIKVPQNTSVPFASSEQIFRRTADKICRR